MSIKRGKCGDCGELRVLVDGKLCRICHIAAKREKYVYEWTEEEADIFEGEYCDGCGLSVHSGRSRARRLGVS